MRTPRLYFLVLRMKSLETLKKKLFRYWYDPVFVLWLNNKKEKSVHSQERFAQIFANRAARGQQTRTDR